MSQTRTDIRIETPAEDDASPGPVLSGTSGAPGIAIGPVYLYTRAGLTVEKRELAAEEVEAEVERFEAAVQKAERDLQKIISLARENLGEESAEIFEAQQLMLRDDALYSAVCRHVREDRFAADYAVMSVLSLHRQRMEASESEYLRERAHDLQDIQDRLVMHLRRMKYLSAVEPGTIIVAENLTAADIILFHRHGILGCATDFGGATSHVSIMARALGVPAVVGLHGFTRIVHSGDRVILDGLNGKVFVNPDEETRALYVKRRCQYEESLREHAQLAPLPAVTQDGHRVHLRANIELKEELGGMAESGSEGIGLMRTEVYLLMKGTLEVTEDQQVELYREIVEATAPHTTTFRLLDLGGDKMLPVAHREHNPFLGWRGLRVLLDRPELLHPHLRALLRSSAYGPLRLMLPMVTTLDEVMRFRKLFAAVVTSLRADGYAMADSIPLGIMVEVPSVALMADQFAREVDFFSIGTNDLTQYTLAVDRGNDLVADLYQELHPSVLRLIRRTIDAGRRQGIPVSLCGELGANPKATPLLVGLGLEEISASPVYLPEIKRIIRAIRRDEAELLAEHALRAADASDVMRLTNSWLKAHGCGIPGFD